MKKTIAVAAVAIMTATSTMPLDVAAQGPAPERDAPARLLTLDSCRAMAMRSNKQMGMAKIKQEVNAHLRKSARTKYLPRVNALGAYVWTSKEVSVLSDEQKSTLSNLGTNTSNDLRDAMAYIASRLPQETVEKLEPIAAQMASSINDLGTGIIDAFRTDTRNIMAGAVTVTQPLFLGGAIVAENKMADINEEMAANSLEARRQSTLYNIDHAYWQVVSLRQKEKLAESFVELVKKLKSDVQRMIDMGVAVKGDGLSVSVRLNEAEMALTQVSDGLALSKMLLCQLCGMPLDENITLADEENSDATVALAGAVGGSFPSETAGEGWETARPELRMLQNAVDLSRQATKMLKATQLPQLLLTGGYALSNPNALNGFEKKFGGLWNVGLLLRVPIWNWGDVKNKVRASKGTTAMASLELDEAREMVELQVSQGNFKVKEAQKKLAMAQANVANADENLRMANLAFKEGTASYTTVMEAQTAWQQAQTQKIDAEIDVRLSQVELQKALGTLN